MFNMVDNAFQLLQQISCGRYEISGVLHPLLGILDYSLIYNPYAVLHRKAGKRPALHLQRDERCGYGPG
jgi:hypothetical protein